MCPAINGHVSSSLRNWDFCRGKGSYSGPNGTVLYALMGRLREAGGGRCLTHDLWEETGRRIVENATLLLDLRRVVFYGRPGDLPTWPVAQRAADERFELVTEIA